MQRDARDVSDVSDVMTIESVNSTRTAYARGTREPQAQGQRGI